MMPYAGPSVVAPVLPPGLDTPALVVDLDVVEANARRLAGAHHAHAEERPEHAARQRHALVEDQGAELLPRVDGRVAPAGPLVPDLAELPRREDARVRRDGQVDTLVACGRTRSRGQSSSTDKCPDRPETKSERWQRS